MTNREDPSLPDLLKGFADRKAAERQKAADTNDAIHATRPAAAGALRSHVVPVLEDVARQLTQAGHVASVVHSLGDKDAPSTTLSFRPVDPARPRPQAPESKARFEWVQSGKIRLTWDVLGKDRTPGTFDILSRANTPHDTEPTGVTTEWTTRLITRFVRTVLDAN